MAPGGRARWVSGSPAKPPAYAGLEDPMCQLPTARPLPLGRQVERTHHSGLITYVSGLIGPEWFERKFLRERSRIY
jgi:hypothetical protein